MTNEYQTRDTETYFLKSYEIQLTRKISFDFKLHLIFDIFT